MLRKTVIALIAGSMALTIAACNTVKGAGEDLQSASETTEDAMNGR
jgi:predicted small secreted protein